MSGPPVRWLLLNGRSSSRIADVPGVGRLLVERSQKHARSFCGYINDEKVAECGSRDVAKTETAKVARQRLIWKGHAEVMAHKAAFTAAISPVQELLHLREDVAEAQAILANILERVARLLPHIKKDDAA
jgi:hypothetical protein